MKLLILVSALMMGAVVADPVNVEFAWSKQAEPPAGYKLFQATAPEGPFTEVADFGVGVEVPDATVPTSTGKVTVESGQKYHFIMKSYNDLGLISGATPTVPLDLTHPNPPENFRVNMVQKAGN